MCHVGQFRIDHREAVVSGKHKAHQCPLPQRLVSGERGHPAQHTELLYVEHVGCRKRERTDYLPCVAAVYGLPGEHLHIKVGIGLRP